MFHSVLATMGNAARDEVDAPTPAPHKGLDTDPTAAGGLWDGVLYFQRCRWCQTTFFRRLLCPVCRSTDIAGEPSDGVGSIYRVGVTGRESGTPRAMAIIDMREGFRLRARVSAVPPNMAHVGALVRLVPDSPEQDINFRLCTA